MGKNLQKTMQFTVWAKALLLLVHKFSKLLLCSISAVPETGLKDPSTCQMPLWTM